MNYFSLLPKMQYGNIQIYNIFYKYNIIDEIPQEYLFDYQMTNGECLEDISMKYYKDTELWWILALINKINDVFYDIIIDDDLIRKMAKNQSTYDGVVNNAEFITKYEYLTKINEAKRVIKVLNPENVSDFISSITRSSQKNTFVDTTQIKLDYSPVDLQEFGLFSSNGQLIDENGQLII